MGNNNAIIKTSIDDSNPNNCISAPIQLSPFFRIITGKIRLKVILNIGFSFLEFISIFFEKFYLLNLKSNVFKIHRILMKLLLMNF